MVHDLKIWRAVPEENRRENVLVPARDGPGEWQAADGVGAVPGHGGGGRGAAGRAGVRTAGRGDPAPGVRRPPRGWCRPGNSRKTCALPGGPTRCPRRTGRTRSYWRRRQRREAPSGDGAAKHGQQAGRSARHGLIRSGAAGRAGRRWELAQHGHSPGGDLKPAVRPAAGQQVHTAGVHHRRVGRVVEYEEPTAAAIAVPAHDLHARGRTSNDRAGTGPGRRGCEQPVAGILIQLGQHVPGGARPEGVPGDSRLPGERARRIARQHVRPLGAQILAPPGAVAPLHRCRLTGPWQHPASQGCRLLLKDKFFLKKEII